MLPRRLPGLYRTADALFPTAFTPDERPKNNNFCEFTRRKPGSNFCSCFGLKDNLKSV